MLFKLFKILTITLLTIILLFFSIVLRLYGVRINDFRLQRNHMNQLVKMYDDQYQPIDESSFLNFEMTDDLRLNQIQMLATHNSYKKTGVPLGRLFVGLGTNDFNEAKALKYGYQTITNQLSLGIRSMEFDLRLRKTNFELNHVPLVDNSSVAPNFKLALEEIKMFSSNHPNHMPIVIIMEIKDDWMILDHALQKIETRHLITLNDLIKDTLEDHLFVPNDMIEPNLSLKASIDLNGWPKINTLLGKVIFVLHPGSFTDLYHQIDETLETLPMFIGLYHNQIDRDYASFVVHNTPDVLLIQQMVAQNLIVRTRMDSDLVFLETRFQNAIESGAQILTTDFSVGRKDIKTSDIIYLDDKKTIILRNT
jgi:hypothetical protein